MKPRQIIGLDYEKIAKMMKAVGWRWFHTPRGRTPTVGEIQDIIMKMVSDVEKMGVGSSLESGGFLIEKIDECDSPKGTIRVIFVGDKGWIYPDA